MIEQSKKVTRIAMWSTPRSLSTALMRSWGSRPDTIVIDEPFHGVDLKLDKWQYNGMKEILNKYGSDWEQVVHRLLEPLPAGKTIFYQKHQAHQTDHSEINLDWIYGLTNCFLIREPKEVIASYLKKWPYIKGDLGFPQLLKIFKLVHAHTGVIPPVINARDLQNKPRKTLTTLCEKIGVPFSETMLLWQKGTRATDGPWTVRGWYDNVAGSTAFKPFKKREITIPSQYKNLYTTCTAVYQELKSFAI